MTDPKNAKYLVHDPNAEETYYCESEAEALAIAKEALENIWLGRDEGIYIATRLGREVSAEEIAARSVSRAMEIPNLAL